MRYLLALSIQMPRSKCTAFQEPAWLINVDCENLFEACLFTFVKSDPFSIVAELHQGQATSYHHTGRYALARPRVSEKRFVAPCENGRDLEVQINSISSKEKSYYSEYNGKILQEIEIQKNHLTQTRNQVNELSVRLKILLTQLTTDRK